MRKIAVTGFLIICFAVGYFGVQKFEARKLVWLGVGLCGCGVLGILIQSQPKKVIRRY
jgi:hypothetical protein